MREFSCQIFRAILGLFVIASSTTAFAGLPPRPRTDFDGDGKADIVVYRRSDQTWYIQKSSGGYKYVRFGNDLDRPVPGDYDGDGIADIAVHRELLPIRGTWWVINSGDQSVSFTTWGEIAFWYFDHSAPADYDGDGKTDLAYYRNGDVPGEPGTYCILQSSTNTGLFIDWGRPELSDKHVPADYDGDGKADLAIYRRGEWWIRQSSNGFVRVEQFGLYTDKVVPGDFDGDGKADLAVWRPSDGVWYWRSSLNGIVNYVGWGLADDKPVPDDYDGDGKTDIAVFRPSYPGIWYILRSTDGTAVFHHFGIADDVPVQNVYVR